MWRSLIQCSWKKTSKILDKKRRSLHCRLTMVILLLETGGFLVVLLSFSGCNFDSLSALSTHRMDWILWRLASHCNTSCKIVDNLTIFVKHLPLLRLFKHNLSTTCRWKRHDFSIFLRQNRLNLRCWSRFSTDFFVRTPALIYCFLKSELFYICLSQDVFILWDKLLYFFKLVRVFLIH